MMAEVFDNLMVGEVGHLDHCLHFFVLKASIGDGG